MNKLLCLLATLALAGCTTTAPDRDNQAKVSYDEFVRTMRAEGFGKADKNGDGIINWDEWQQLDNSPNARRHFDSLDANSNGKVTADEWKAGLEKTGVSMSLFKQLDTDQSGYLGPSELKRRPVSGLFQLNF
jgi:Ca2+-binding EF-hand superfamily protein